MEEYSQFVNDLKSKLINIPSAITEDGLNPQTTTLTGLSRKN
jgi:hypothetical protein